MDCNLLACLSMRQEYWSGLPFLSPGHILGPDIKSISPAWQADSLPLRHEGSPSQYFGDLENEGIHLILLGGICDKPLA